MLTVSLAEAKTRLSELLDKVEAGEEVIVTRHGRPVAQIRPAPTAKKPLDFDKLAAIRAKTPPLSKPSVELLREMRDEER
jgi:prevent-host-death family protein